MYRGMETLARLLGPKEVTASTLGGKPFWQWMEETATYWQNLTLGCNTPACGPGTQNQAQAAVEATAASVPCKLEGVYYGCGGPTPSATSCKGPKNMPMTITTMGAPYGASVHVDFPAGATNKWWSVGIGNETTDGTVTLSLYEPGGQPYATPPYLVGKTSGKNCDAIEWANTKTSWCRNGTSSWCTGVPQIAPDGLADYGTETHLLECVPTYTHKVAALNAANAWMMRGSATVAEGRGEAGRAAELRALADNISSLVRTKLYVEGNTDGGFWYAEQPNGYKVPVRHVIDFISIGTALADDLSPTQKRQMSGFVKRELLAGHWMRALSLNDSSLLHPSANSDRKDHGPLGGASCQHHVSIMSAPSVRTGRQTDSSIDMVMDSSPSGCLLIGLSGWLTCLSLSYSLTDSACATMIWCVFVFCSENSVRRLARGDNPGPRYDWRVRRGSEADSCHGDCL